VGTDKFRKLGVAQKKAIEWAILNEMRLLGENNNSSTNSENESKIQSVTSQGEEVAKKEVSRGESNNKLTAKRTENKTKAVSESKIQPVTSQGEEEVAKEVDHGENCNMPADEKLNSSKTTANKAVSKKELQLKETIAKLSKQIIKAAEDEKDLFKKLENANKLAESLQRENEELKAALLIAKGRQQG